MKELKNKFDMGFNEINHKIHMKVKKDYQAIISPLLQSMPSICCKIMEHIIHSSVLTHLENTNILSDEQHASAREDHVIPS